MALATTPMVNFGWIAPDFELPATDGKTYRLSEFKGEKGTVIIFMCNHCPYVKAVLDKIVHEAKALEGLGVNTLAISSNDAQNYPADSFENMAELAKEKAFPFPYLFDETQAVAHAYDAQCTPDYFGFNADLELQYRGRLDDARGLDQSDTTRRELFEAMSLIAQTGKGPETQFPSMGCSIKWK